MRRHAVGGPRCLDFPEGASLAVSLSLDGEEFSEVYRHDNMADASIRVPLDSALGVHGNDPRRAYWIRIDCVRAKGAALRQVTLHTDLYAYPVALPRLSVGENTVSYQDDTPEDHAVTITYRWRESENVTPPAPPTAPGTPGPDAEIHATYVPFAWPSVAGCDAYWLRVSRSPALRYPYRPNYDVILPENRYEVPFRGMFSPGETYYWRVRPRLENGLWGDWSETWHFTWNGPTVPKPVLLHQDGEDRLVFRWQANPSGTRPVRYRVYGSNERGFSIGNAMIAGLQPGLPAAV